MTKPCQYSLSLFSNAPNHRFSFIFGFLYANQLIFQASAAGLSKHFKNSGVPAILVYRSGDLVHSFVRLADTLGEDFYASDLESFLIENGVLSETKLTPSSIKGPSVQTQDSDSD